MTAGPVMTAGQPKTDDRADVPEITGLHHLALDIENLEVNTKWFEQVLDASHVKELDHYDNGGERYAVIITIPGLPGLLQLREATGRRPVQKGYDLVTFRVADRDALAVWKTHFDSCAVKHTEISRRKAGYALDFYTPDGITLRLYANFSATDQN